MNSSRSIVGVFLALVLLCGCERIHFRPRGVPSSAKWIDGVYLDCSSAGNPNEKSCTVYEDRSGKILAEGVFAPVRSTGEVGKTGFRYAGYREASLFQGAILFRTILLEDGSELSLSKASERDPTNRLILEKLKSISSMASANPEDCGISFTSNPSDEAASCGIRAFTNHKPFFVRYRSAEDVPRYSYGLAGDPNGNVYEAAYRMEAFNKLGVSKRTQLLENGHLNVTPCPKPVTVARAGDGMLACFWPQSKEAQPTAGQLKPVDTTICEIATNPFAFNNRMVRVRGRVSGNFEYSTIEGDGDGCQEGLWFAYGDGSGPPGLLATIGGGSRPGAETADGEWIPPIEVKLVRNSTFAAFQRLMEGRVRADAVSEKLLPKTYVSHYVVATFIGRIDGVTPEIHAAHVRRKDTDRADYLGFGQMGLFDAQLVVQYVEGPLRSGKSVLHLGSPLPR